ncbi:unnamed protein product [Soboliphyme baturini]|uniref:WD_REPEATS_REGION domain-containing protein n=1 Tax=Soboliphyme baturini TaxID=241478 RepID=A0A183IM60_9BILA|nr:unnamed protein product [Soboliphyme baturini]
MGLTKQYLRYAPIGTCNLVASPGTSIAYLDDKHCVVGAAENVYVWNLAKSEKVGEFAAADHSRATIVKVSRLRRHLAVGYANGTINIFDPNDRSTARVTFVGHRSEVTCLAFSADDLLICSGGKDCAVIIWDIVNEAGLYRLIGHSGPVTECYFARHDVLITSSKDSLLKFWDLSCQHCFYTLSVSRSEVWCFICAKEDQFLLVGTAESELYAYRIQWLVSEDEVELRLITSLDNESDSLILGASCHVRQEKAEASRGSDERRRR